MNLRTEWPSDLQAAERASIAERVVTVCIAGEEWQGFVVDEDEDEGRYVVRLYEGGALVSVPDRAVRREGGE